MGERQKQVFVEQLASLFGLAVNFGPIHTAIYQDNTNLSGVWQRLINQNERAKGSERALTHSLSGKHLIRTARFKRVLKMADFRLA